MTEPSPKDKTDSYVTKPPAKSRGVTDGTEGTQEIKDTYRDTPSCEESQPGDPYSLNLHDFIKWAIEEHSREQGEPGYGYAYKTPLWTFTRLIKGYLDTYSDGDADAAFEVVDAVMQEMPEGWSIFQVEDDEEAYEEFVTCWSRVRYRPGYDPVETAIEKAKEYPLKPERCEKRKLEGYKFFVSVAGWLQVCMGDRDIMLPCQNMAELLTEAGVKCTKMSVSRWRRMAIQDGYLVVVGEHKYRPNAKGIATRFRFDVSLWDVLEGAAEKGTVASFEYAKDEEEQE